MNTQKFVKKKNVPAQKMEVVVMWLLVRDKDGWLCSTNTPNLNVIHLQGSLFLEFCLLINVEWAF